MEPYLWSILKNINEKHICTENNNQSITIANILNIIYKYQVIYIVDNDQYINNKTWANNKYIYVILEKLSYNVSVNNLNHYYIFSNNTIQNISQNYQIYYIKNKIDIKTIYNVVSFYKKKYRCRHINNKYIKEIAQYIYKNNISIFDKYCIICLISEHIIPYYTNNKNINESLYDFNMYKDILDYDTSYVNIINIYKNIIINNINQ